MVNNTHISGSIVHKYHKTVFIAFFNILGLVTVLGAKISKNSYLREFCEQVSQIVLFADLTVLQLVTTV